MLSAAALALALAVAGCTTTGTATDDAGSGSNWPAESDAEPANDEAAQPEPGPEPVVANPKFGESYTWEDAVAVTISASTPFEPSDYAIAGDAAAHHAFDLTLVNGTARNLDPSMFYTTLQSANVEAEQVFDSENGFSVSPSTPLLPGREAVYKIGYGVVDPADLVMAVQPTWDHEAALFTS